MRDSLSVPDRIVSTWQEILQIAAEIMDVPAALIMRLETDTIEVFASSSGSSNPYHVGEREQVWGSGLYCERVVNTKQSLEVENALEDSQWQNNPDIKLSMISYLGYPILLPDNTPFGTICVLDSRRRSHSNAYKKLLGKFRDLIQHDLELLYMNHTLDESFEKMSEYLGDLQKLKGIVSICSYCKCILGQDGSWHPIESYLIGHPQAQFSHGICPRCIDIAP